MFKSWFTLAPLLTVCGLLTFSCTQYKPQGPVKSLGQGEVGLVPTACVGKKEVFKIAAGSSARWQLETIAVDGKSSSIGSDHPASGYLETVRGALTQSKGLVTFGIEALNTGDVKRDRVLLGELFTESGVETFRFMLEKIDTPEVSVDAGATKNLSMVGLLEIGGRRAQIIFPAQVSEGGGLYTALGGVEILTRETRPAINAINLLDRVQGLEQELGVVLGNSLRLDMQLRLQKDCK
jgi:hypothetical protein